MDSQEITKTNLEESIHYLYNESERVPSFDTGIIPFFKTNNYKSPELFPIITVINKFFNYSNDAYCDLLKPSFKIVKRYFDTENYYLSFKLNNIHDIYTITINKELTCCSKFLLNNRKVSLPDYVELLNLLYPNISTVDKLIKDHL